MHLRVITARDQIRTGQRRQLDGLTRHRQLAREHAADERFGPSVRRVVHDQTAAAEHLLEPLAERVGHAGAGRVGAAQFRQKIFTECCRRQDALGLVEHADDGVVQLDGGDGGRFGAGTRRKRDGPRSQIGVEHRTRTDFFPVVILGVDPENGDDRHAVIA